MRIFFFRLDTSAYSLLECSTKKTKGKQKAPGPNDKREASQMWRTGNTRLNESSLSVRWRLAGYFSGEWFVCTFVMGGFSEHLLWKVSL